MFKVKFIITIILECNIKFDKIRVKNKMHNSQMAKIIILEGLTQNCVPDYCFRYPKR